MSGKNGKSLIHCRTQGVTSRILKKMKIILQTGSRDEFSINIGMRGLSNILHDNGVDHQFMEYDAGHFGIDYFYEESLPELINGLIH